MKTLKLFLPLLICLIGCSPKNFSIPNPIPTPIPFPKTQVMYVLNSADNTIGQWKIGSDGTLTTLAPSIATDDYPRAMAMDEQHNSLYVANIGSQTITQYKTGVDGTLSELTTPIASSAFTESLVMSLDHRFLYSLGYDGVISQYSLGSDGELTLLNDWNYPNNPVAMTFSSSGKFAYMVNDAITDISQYSVAADGSFTPLTPATVSSRGCPSGPILSAQSKSGIDFIYVLSCSTDEIEAYSVGNDGTLNSEQVVNTGALPSHMTISGNFLYTTNMGDSTVSMFTIGSNGLLQASTQAAVAVGTQLESVVVDGSGKFAYVMDYVEDKIFPLNLGTDGIITPFASGGVQSGAGPRKALIKSL
jgi:6-phosphogluconolactonase